MINPKPYVVPVCHTCVRHAARYGTVNSVRMLLIQPQKLGEAFEQRPLVPAWPAWHPGGPRCHRVTVPLPRSPPRTPLSGFTKTQADTDWNFPENFY